MQDSVAKESLLAFYSLIIESSRNKHLQRSQLGHGIGHSKIIKIFKIIFLICLWYHFQFLFWWMMQPSSTCSLGEIVKARLEHQVYLFSEIK